MRSTLLLLLVLSFSLSYAQEDNWINVSSPIGKMTSFVTVDNGNKILMGTSRGAWKSNASLSDWKPSNNGMEEKYITVMHKMDGVIFSGNNKGFYRSTNEGSDWIKCSLPDSNYSCIISTNKNLLVVKAYPGPLFVSSDFGESWKKIIVGETENERKNIFWNREVLSDSAGNLFIASDSVSFYYSKDDGANWSRESIPVNGKGYKSRLVINGTQIIFRTGNRQSFYTKKSGGNWEELKTPGGRYKNLYLSPHGSLILETSEPDNKYESFDNGFSWQPITDVGTIENWERLSNGNLVAIGSNYFYGSMLMVSTDDGLSWTYPVSSFSEISVFTAGNDNYLYVGTKWSGAYRSGDFGLTWQPVLSEPVIKDIVLTGNVLAVLTTLDGVFLLTNDCKTVKRAGENGLDDTGVTSLLSTRDGVIFAGSYSRSVEIPLASGGKTSAYEGGGLWRSTDFGNSWNRIFLDSSVKTPDSGKTWLKLNSYSQTYRPTSQPDLSIVSMGISPDGALLVEANVDYRTGLYTSSDNGETWTKIRTLGIDEDARTNLVKTSQGEIFTGQGLLFAGISRSTDGGSTFNDVVNGLPSGDKNDLIAIPGGDVLCTTNDGIYYLPFKGNTWSRVAFKGEKVNRIVWYGEYIFASVDFKDGEHEPGIYRIPLVKLKDEFPSGMSEAEVWKEMNKPFENNLSLFEIDKSGEYWAVDNSKMLKHSTDEGGDWKMASLPDDFVYELKVDNKNNTVWIGTSHGLFHSTSHGEKWEKVELPAFASEEPYNSVLPEAIYFDDNGDILVASTEWEQFNTGHLYIGKDGGDKWQPMEAILPGNPSSLFRSKSGKLFCAVGGSGLFYSTNNGGDWTDCNKGLLPTGVVYMCNFGAEADRSVGSVNILEDGTMYVVRGGRGIAKTTDEGVNWTYLPPPGEYVWDIYVSPEKTIYAATDMGVFKTENEGKNWTSFSTGLFSSSISTLIRDRNGYLVAVASDGRIYKTIEKID